MGTNLYNKLYIKYKNQYHNLKFDNQIGGIRDIVEKSDITRTFASNNLVLDVNKLFITTKYMKVRQYPISDLDHVLDEIAWEEELGLTPKQVMKVKSMKNKKLNKLLKTHQKRIGKANLDYPILLMTNNMADTFGFTKNYQYKYIVIDGIHRLMRAVNSGQKTINGTVLTEDVVRDALV